MKSKPDLHLLAITFLKQHQGEHLTPDRRLLVERCVTHLIHTVAVSTATAEDVTLQALSELDSRHRREFVDLARTTAFAVFVQDPLTGRKRVFTLADLMKLVRTPALTSQPVPSARSCLANGVSGTEHSSA